MAINNDFIVKSGLVVKSTATVPDTASLVTTNIVRTIAKPALDLNFIRSSTLDPRVSFSRASGATYTNSSGFVSYAAINQPRIDYDPITGQCKGLLIEDARTNIVTNSTTLSGANWGLSAATSLSNAGISPDGTNTAYRLIEDTGVVNRHYAQFTVTITTNTYYTASAYVKAGTNNFATVIFGQGGAPYARGGLVVDLTSGTYTNYTASSPTSVYRWTPTNVGNGWWKVSVTVNVNTTVTSGYLELGTAQTMGSLTYAGNGTGSIYIWGPQIEASSFPTSYIPTGSAQATRQGDYAVMAGQPVSSVIGATPGTVYVEFDTITTGVSATGGNDFPFIYDIDSQIDQDNYGFRMLASAGYGPGLQTSMSTAQTSAVKTLVTPLGQLDVKKIATTFQINDFAVAFNGSVSTSTGPTVLPTGMFRISLGTQSYNGGFGNFLTGHIRRLTYWPQRLTNDQIQALTL